MQELAGQGYTFGEVETALRTHRYETFRHELHRQVGGQWTVIANLDKQVVRGCTIKYDRWGKSFMRSATYDLYDDGTLIDFRKDAIRTFWEIRMPNGGIREWCMGTFYAVSPSVPLKSPKIRRLEAPDALVNLEQSKLTDWLTIPSTPRAGSHAEETRSAGSRRSSTTSTRWQG